ncbi:5'-3' exonuclease [Roseospira marina]|nr:5'-3' exonuclease [Roseospira marina]
MSDGYVLIDGNSIGFAAQTSHKLSAGGSDTTAIFGVIRSVRQFAAQYGATRRLIVLWDGKGWRHTVYPEYKAHRSKPAVTAHEKAQRAARDSYKAQKKDIMRGLSLMGVDQVIAANMEADDLAAILTDRYRKQGKRILLISGDKDWLQLVGNKVAWFDPIRGKIITAGTFNEHTGLVNTRQFVEEKCLIGEPGDLGPGSGVGGIGAKKARDLLERFGSVGGFLNAWMDGSLKDEKLPKAFRDFADETLPGQSIFERNKTLVDLRTSARPSIVGLRVIKGAPDRDAFTEFCGAFAFQSILKDLDGFLEPFENAQKEAA